MENKYLPIGTVCTLKNNNKKIMIISYFSLEYNGNVKMYDYKGCVYPEGLLLPSQALSFNHDDIENIEYIGYKNEQYEVLNNTLNRGEQEDVEFEKTAVMSNFKFDENGVVVFDGNVEETNEVVNDNVLTTSNFNPFKAETNYAADDQTNNNIFKFDENGVVISDDTVNENNEVQSTSRYQFDENGFVIGEIDNIEEKIENNSNIQFDENGIVISDGTVTENNEIQSTPKYEFDENGTIISDGKTVLELKPANMPSYKFDENGTVIEDETVSNQQPEQLTSNIQFDENGFVISE